MKRLKQPGRLSSKHELTAVAGKVHKVQAYMHAVPAVKGLAQLAS